MQKIEQQPELSLDQLKRAASATNWLSNHIIMQWLLLPPCLVSQAAVGAYRHAAKALRAGIGIAGAFLIGLKKAILFGLNGRYVALLIAKATALAGICVHLDFQKRNTV